MRTEPKLNHEGFAHLISLLGLYRVLWKLFSMPYLSLISLEKTTPTCVKQGRDFLGMIYGGLFKIITNMIQAKEMVEFVRVLA
jgi:hypothetical protein